MSTMSAAEQLTSLISALETDLGIDANAPLPTDKKPAKAEAKKEKAPKPAAKKAAPADADQPEITKLDIRVGRIVKVWKHESADKYVTILVRCHGEWGD
jgi:aminoacyl tRNA synthase complex-interacting multifunctional protein 1